MTDSPTTDPRLAVALTASAGQTANLCDCELGHNGLGLAGRECDCPAGQSDDYWHGWNAAFDDENFNASGSLDWKRGYTDARRHQSADEAELIK